LLFFVVVVVVDVIILVIVLAIITDIIVVTIGFIKFVKQIIFRFLMTCTCSKKLLAETASSNTRLCILQDHQVLLVPRDFRECVVSQGSQDP